MALVEIIYEGNLRTNCRNLKNRQEIKTDAPIDNQGKGEFFSPTDLLALALATCTATLMGIAAQQCKVDLTGMRLTVEKSMAVNPRRIGKIVIHIFCTHQFSIEIQQRLETAGKYCPVHHSLHPELVQEFHFHWGQP